MKININIDFKVGRVVKYFVLSDLFLLAGWGFIEPVFSIFIIDHVVGATLTTVGIAAAIYWLLRSVLEIPIGNYLDKTPGERDDFMALVASLFLAAFSAFAFVAVDRVWELYLVQAIHAIAFAFYFPSWSAIFSRHLDKTRVSFDWSLDSTAAGIAAGISGLLSGFIAQYFGFFGIFFAAGFLSMAAGAILMTMPDLVLPKPTTPEALLKDHTPTNIGM